MRHTSTLFITGLALLSLSLNLFAKTADIGVAAIAVESELVGKGEFNANDNVNEGDGVKTHPKGTTTILFKDESILTLGPDAIAKIEVYQQGTKGKPGKSIIRVVKGQFRYIPGTILQNGGSQFVAVGDKLLGKTNARDGDSASAAQSANASSTGTGQSAGHNASESEHGNQSNGNGQSGEEHGNSGSTSDSGPVAEGETGTGDSTPPAGPGSDHASTDTDSGTSSGGEHSGGTSGGGSSNPGLNADSFVVAGMGLGTGGGGTGGTGGVQYNCVEPPCGGGFGGFGGVVGGNMIPGDNFMIAGAVDSGGVSYGFLNSAGQTLAGLDGSGLSGSFNFNSTNLQPSLGANLQTNLGGAGSLQTNLGTTGSIATGTGSVSGSFASPSLTVPTTAIAPTFTAPTFTAPTTTIAPTFTAPTFTAPTTTIAPTFTAPKTIIAPTFIAPKFR